MVSKNRRRNRKSGLAEAEPTAPQGKQVFGYVTKTNNFVSKMSLKTKKYPQTAGKSAQSRQILEETDEIGGNFSSLGTKGLVEPPFDPKQLIGLLEINAFHARCVQTKSTDAAGSGYEILPKGNKTNKTQKDRAERFFDNLTVPINETLRDVFNDYEAIGHGAIEILRENNIASNPIVDLKHIPAHTLRVHRSRDKFCQIRGTKKVWFKNIQPQTHITFDVEQDSGSRLRRMRGGSRGNEIMFFKKYTQFSDFYGAPDIVPALGAVLGDHQREDYVLSFFSNYGVPAWAVFVTGDYDPGPLKNDYGVEVGPEDSNGRTDLERAIETHLAELADNPHSTLMLAIPSARRKDGSPGNVEVVFQKLSDDVKEASFAKFRKDNRDEVIIAHGVPVSRLGVPEGGSLGGDSSEAVDEIYKRSRIDPMQTMIEAPFTRLILGEELGVYDYVFNLPDLDTKDLESKIEVAVQLFNMGMMTPNQGIKYFGKEFGLEPVKGVKELDYHFVGGAALELGLSKDPESTQGQRGADEETAGAEGRGERGGEAGQRQQVREGIESNGSLSEEEKDRVKDTVSGGRDSA